MKRLLLSIPLCCMYFCSAAAGADNTVPNHLTAVDQANHAKFVKLMPLEQTKALANIYPGFKILKLCSGNFSGQNKDEFVLGLWKPADSKAHRVGLIRNGNEWKVHVIDDEIKMNLSEDTPSPMSWQYLFAKSGFEGAMKCGIESEFGENSDLTYALGDKPIFNLKKNGLENNKVSCFATDDVYNNWDCVVYSPKDNRFKLWFQQAHAD